MRPGDQAYAQSVGLCQLLDRGTSGGGDAVWLILSAQTTRFFESPTGADFYRAAAGVMPGADDFILAFYVRWEALSASGAGFPRLAASLSAAAGWEINWNFGTLEFHVVDGAGVTLNAPMGPSWFDGNVGFAYMQNRDVLVHMRVFQSGGVTELQGLINGALVASTTAANAGVNPSVNPADLLGVSAVLWSGGMHGCSYFEGTATDRELIEHADACIGQGRHVAGPIAWDNLWNANDNVPGATWVPTIGADNLTEQGTTALFTRYRRPG